MDAIMGISLVIAIIVTIAAVTAENPYPKGTDEYQALRLCRIGLALDFWSFGFGLLGVAFAITAFVLGIIGIVKGRTAYGLGVIVGAVVSQILSIYVYFWDIARWLSHQ